MTLIVRIKSMSGLKETFQLMHIFLDCLITPPTPPPPPHLLASLATPASFPVEYSIIQLINRLIAHTAGTRVLHFAGSMDIVMLTGLSSELTLEKM